MTTSEHADLIAEARGILLDGDNYTVLARMTAALASTPSPAQPTEVCEREELLAEATGVLAFRGYGSEKGIDVFKRMYLALTLDPSPVQGADDRLAAIIAEVQELTRQGYPTGILVRLIAAYQQSPQAALNEVRADALDDLGDHLAKYSLSPQDTLEVIRDRAAELRAAPQAGDSE